MKINGIVYKGLIKELNDKLETVSTVKAFYKIINVGNTYFFAEEISTGCIFPIYFAVPNGTIRLVNHYSLLLGGKYFAFFPVMPSDQKPFEFVVNEKALKKNYIIVANHKEQEEYLDTMDCNLTLKKKFREMEAENSYVYGLDYLKELLQKVKYGEFEYISSISNKKNDVIDLKEIEDYGYNMSGTGDASSLIDRENEIKTIIKRVFINNKSVVLVGTSGSGKTTIVKKIAEKIDSESNKWLKDKVIFNLNLASLVGGTRYRGEFEERMNKVIEFCRQHRGKLIIFIDEIHNIYGLGKSQDTSFDAMNMLKPYLENEDLTIIGTTTDSEFSKYMAKDEAFLRRFTCVPIPAPDSELNKKILNSYIKDLERKYDIKLDFTEEEKLLFIDFLIDITNLKNQKVVGDIPVTNPTISKNIIEEAFGEALYNELDKVSVNEICFAILNCEKLSPTFRKERALELRQRLNVKINNRERSRILKLSDTFTMN